MRWVLHFFTVGTNCLRDALAVKSGTFGPVWQMRSKVKTVKDLYRALSRACTHTCTHTHTHAYTHTHTHTHTQRARRPHTHTHIPAGAHAHTHKGGYSYCLLNCPQLLQPGVLRKMRWVLHFFTVGTNCLRHALAVKFGTFGPVWQMRGKVKTVQDLYRALCRACTHTCTHTHTYVHTQIYSAHAHTHTHTRTRARARTHTHTHTRAVIHTVYSTVHSCYSRGCWAK